MSDQTNPTNPASHGGFEPRDVGIAGVFYFLAGLAAACLLAYFIVGGLYSVLQKRNEAEQAPVSPLVTNAPTDTRHIPPQYKTDAESSNYEKYLKQNFPAPQLEIDERTQLDSVRLREEQTLASYGYVDQQAGTVRIPIERAMELIAQRGLPARAEGEMSAGSGTAAAVTNTSAKEKKGKKR
jgi:hypothetical protein